MLTFTIMCFSDAALLVSLALLAPACISASSLAKYYGNGDAGAGGGPGGDGGAGGSADLAGVVVDLALGQEPDLVPCTSLRCQHHDCGGQAPTRITGVVYDPAGNNPLYNVVVYIPNTTPHALPTGASCAPCASLYSGEPLAVALTDAHGAFTLSGVPDGDNIPLVIQVGKWRRQLVLPRVLPCQDNAVPDKTARLPRNHMEGDLPSIAMSTGNADSLECMLTRVGIDPSEFVGGAGGSGRVHVFAGGGTFAPNTSPAGPLSATALWSSAQSLMPYDLVVLSCEGAETTNMNQAALHDYATAGGRVLASHFHYAWFNTGPYGAENLAQWTTGSNDIGNVSASVVGTFPKGAAYATWLGAVGALTNNLLPIQQARHNADVGPGNTHSQAWLSTPMPMATELFTFNTPTNAPTACGRVTWTGIHVGGASNDYVGGTSLVPTGCTAGKLSVQERALEFALFDLSACISPDSVAPTAPIQP